MFKAPAGPYDLILTVPSLLCSSFPQRPMWLTPSRIPCSNVTTSRRSPFTIIFKLQPSCLSPALWLSTPCCTPHCLGPGWCLLTLDCLPHPLARMEAPGQGAGGCALCTEGFRHLEHCLLCTHTHQALTDSCSIKKDSPAGSALRAGAAAGTRQTGFLLHRFCPNNLNRRR